MQIAPVSSLNFKNNVVNNTKVRPLFTQSKDTVTFGKSSNEEVLKVVSEVFKKAKNISNKSKTGTIIEVFDRYSEKAKTLLDDIEKGVIPLLDKLEVLENAGRKVVKPEEINVYKKKERIYFEQFNSKGETTNLLVFHPSPFTKSKWVYCLETRNLDDKNYLMQAFLDIVGRQDFYVGQYVEKSLSPYIRVINSAGSRNLETLL